MRLSTTTLTPAEPDGSNTALFCAPVRPKHLEGKPSIHVGINAYFLGKSKTGVGTYTRELVRHLSSLEQDTANYTLYVQGRSNLEHLPEVLANPRFAMRHLWPPNRLFWIGAGYSLASRLDDIDVFHDQHYMPAGLKCKTVLTIHDLLFERFPAIYSRADRMKLKAAARWSCSRADYIVTPSEATKRDLIEIYRRAPETIAVTHLGPAECYRPVDREAARETLRAKYGIESDFILHVGLIHPRKNLIRLVEAIGELKRKNRLTHQLVLVGPEERIYQRYCQALFQKIRDLNLIAGVLWTKYVPAADIPLFYNAASVFVYPSLCEGFGLPVVEAMACGTPTVTSFGSSLEEVAGEAALLIDPLSVSEIASAIDKIVSDTCLQRELAHKGIQRAAQFSYKHTAEQTRLVYEKLLS